MNISIGNDIIFWRKAKNQHQKLRSRSLNKIFQEHEINYIQSADKPILAFWHLWSVKESAYKAWQRQQKTKPIFNPRSFVCHNITLHLVKVCNVGFLCEVKTIYTPDYIYSECLYKHRRTKIFKSSEAFLYFKNYWEQKGLSVIKEKYNIPSLYDEQKNIHYPVSLSHDYHLTAITGCF